MSNQKSHKIDFINLLKSSMELSTCDFDAVKQYFDEEGINAKEVANEGLKRIRKIRLKIQTKNTLEEIEKNKSLKEEALKWAENILANSSFSFHEFVAEKNLVLHNRNIESFNLDDIKSTLTNYYYLHILNKKDDPKI